MLETYQSHSQHRIQIVIELLYLQVWLYVQAQGQLNIVLALRYNRVGRLFIAAVSELYPPAAATLRRVKQHGFLLNLAKLLKRTFWRWTGNVGQFVPRPQTQDRPECSQSRLGQVSSLCKLHCCLMLYHEWLTRWHGYSECFGRGIIWIRTCEVILRWVNNVKLYESIF